MRKASYHETLHYLKKRAERNAYMDDKSIFSVPPRIQKFAEAKKTKFAAAMFSLKKLFGYV